jgi:hypothetical protein
MTHSKNKVVFLVFGVLVFASCTKNFKQLNTTPNAPTNTAIAPLMTNIMSTLFLQWQEQASIHNDYYYEATQLAAETSVSGYVLSNGVNSIWDDYYNTLQNLNLVQDKINAVSDKASMVNIQAILYTLRAYKTFRITDQFGDIPYFKAGLTYTGNTDAYRPPYDPQQVIYDSLLNNLTWAVHNMNLNSGAVTPSGDPVDSLGSADVLFDGNLTEWLKFANSLRLRYAMQMVEKDPATASPIIADCLSGTYPLIDSGNDVGMWPKSLGGYDLQSRWWSFSSGGTGFVRISSTMWNLLADDTSAASVFDPRAWLFTTTNQAGQYVPYIIGTSTGDAVNAYYSATDPTQKNNCLYSPLNWYLVRDEWYIPELVMTSAEVDFLAAEAYARGLGVTQSIPTAQAAYLEGITSSVNFWYNVAANTNDPTEDWASAMPGPPGDVQWAAFLSNPKVAFTGTQADAVSKIYAQEWLSFFRQPWLAFNLWRRTSATPVDPKSNPSSTLSTFYRLPYAQDEAVNNAVNYEAEIAKLNGNNSNVKVWWMP